MICCRCGCELINSVRNIFAVRGKYNNYRPIFLCEECRAEEYDCGAIDHDTSRIFRLLWLSGTLFDNPLDIAR